MPRPGAAWHFCGRSCPYCFIARPNRRSRKLVNLTRSKNIALATRARSLVRPTPTNAGARRDRISPASLRSCNPLLRGDRRVGIFLSHGDGEHSRACARLRSAHRAVFPRRSWRLRCTINPRSKETLVDTIDLHPNYAVDRTKLVGFEIPDLVPDLAGAVAVHTQRESDFVPNLARPNELALVFVDADHQHPWPLLDLLRVTPYLQSGGWIVLHDIQLGTMAATRPEQAATLIHGAPFGAEWLFDCWPFAKISGGNIGAVQLPRDRRALLPSALALIARPFEVGAWSHRKFRKELGRSLVDLIE
jgi:methyltransferase family protein